MKITIERGALLKSLGHVQSVVERRNTIPILSNVKIDAADGQLGLNATDMDLDIVEQVTADVGANGNINIARSLLPPEHCFVCVRVASRTHPHSKVDFGDQLPA